MCQALPARVVRIEGCCAWVDGADTAVSLLGLDGVAVGDYILHHAGLALERLEPEEAAAITEAFQELESLYEEEDRRGAQHASDVTAGAGR